jgi:hypothetical protein
LGNSWSISLGILSCMASGIYDLGRRSSEQWTVISVISYQLSVISDQKSGFSSQNSDIVDLRT